MKRFAFLKALGALAVIPFIPKQEEEVQELWVNESRPYQYTITLPPPIEGKVFKIQVNSNQILIINQG